MTTTSTATATATDWLVDHGRVRLLLQQALKVAETQGARNRVVSQCGTGRQRRSGWVEQVFVAPGGCGLLPAGGGVGPIPTSPPLHLTLAAARQPPRTPHPSPSCASPPTPTPHNPTHTHTYTPDPHAPCVRPLRRNPLPPPPSALPPPFRPQMSMLQEDPDAGIVSPTLIILRLSPDELGVRPVVVLGDLGAVDGATAAVAPRTSQSGAFGMFSLDQNAGEWRWVVSQPPVPVLERALCACTHYHICNRSTRSCCPLLSAQVLAHPHIHTYARTRMHARMHTHACTHALTHMHAHARTHTLTHTRASLFSAHPTDRRPQALPQWRALSMARHPVALIIKDCAAVSSIVMGSMAKVGRSPPGRAGVTAFT